MHLEELSKSKVDTDCRVAELDSQIKIEKAATSVLKKQSASLQSANEELLGVVTASKAVFDSAQKNFDDTGKADIAKIADLESKSRKDKVQIDQLSKSKTALDSRVSELEAQMKKDKAHADELEKTNLLVTECVAELEAQLKGEMSHSLSLQTQSIHMNAAMEASQDQAESEVVDLITQLKQKDVELHQKDLELLTLRLKVDEMESENNTREKENRNNLQYLNEAREKKGLLEASTAELQSQVGELEAHRDRLRVKAAHARFGLRQDLSDPSRLSGGRAGGPGGAFDLTSEVDMGGEDFEGVAEDSESDSDNSGGRMGIFVDRGDSDSDGDKSRVYEVRDRDNENVDLDTLRNRELNSPSVATKPRARAVRQVFLDMDSITLSDDDI